MRTNQLIIALFQRFCWLDEGLQARLHDHGWPDVNRPQSMVMTNIVSGVVRPSDIARNLGVSRQAIHSTINQMVKLGMVRLDVDPDDRRHMIVSLTDLGARMRKDAQRSMDALTAYRGKAAAIMSASISPFGGLRGLMHLRQILSTIQMLVIPEQVVVPAAHAAFAEDGSLKEPLPASLVDMTAGRLIAVAKALAA